MKKSFLAISLPILSACAPSVERSERILLREGYTDVHVEGYTFLGCSDSDGGGRHFKAKKNGELVRGFVCGGTPLSFKGITIRLLD